MPTVMVSKDIWKDAKQYLVDVDGITLGELFEQALIYALQDLEDFEDFLGIEELDEEESEEEPESEEEEKEED